MAKRNSHLIWFCKVALMVALLLALHTLNLAMIPTPWGASLTLDCLIVVVAALAIDRKAGWVVAAAFGGMSAYGSLTASFVGVNAIVMIPIVEASAMLVIAVALLSRLCIPYGISLSEKLLAKTKLSHAKQMMIVSVCGSLTNTFMYVGMIMLVRLLVGVSGNQLGVLMGWAAGAIAFNGVPEAILTGIVAPPIVSALKRIK